MQGISPSGAAMGDAFWRFSLAFYAREGVPERCLRLQDLGGWDVNLALFCLWAGFAHGRLEPEALDEAAALSGAWRKAAVAPLRGIRRALKSGVAAPGADRLAVETFRQEIKRIELLAEERQQRAIAPLAARSTAPPCREAAAQALAHIALSAALQGGSAAENAEKNAESLGGDQLYLLDAAERFFAERH